MNQDVKYLIGTQMSPSDSRRYLTGESEEKSILKYFELNPKKFTDLDRARIIIVLIEFKLNKPFSFFKSGDFETLDAFEIYDLLTNTTLEKVLATKYNKIGFLLLKENIAKFLELPANKIKLLAQVFKKYNYTWSGLTFTLLNNLKEKRTGRIIDLIQNLNAISE